MVAELIDGELFATPRPADPPRPMRHSHSAVFSALRSAPRAIPPPGGWWLLFGPSCISAPT